MDSSGLFWIVTESKLLVDIVFLSALRIGAEVCGYGNGGGGEIRTHGRVTPTTVFKTAALNRSATPPY